MIPARKTPPARPDRVIEPHTTQAGLGRPRHPGRTGPAAARRAPHRPAGHARNLAGLRCVSFLRHLGRVACQTCAGVPAQRLELQDVQVRPLYTDQVADAARNDPRRVFSQRRAQPTDMRPQADFEPVTSTLVRVPRTWHPNAPACHSSAPRMPRSTVSMGLPEARIPQAHPEPLPHPGTAVPAPPVRVGFSSRQNLAVGERAVDEPMTFALSADGQIRPPTLPAPVSACGG
jgi:hypothetical protein